MSLFELVALVAMLSSIVAFLIAMVSALRGRSSKTARILRRWAICAVAYLCISLAVSFLRPQRVLALGDPWCLDDWCLEVRKVGTSRKDPVFLIR